MRDSEKIRSAANSAIHGGAAPYKPNSLDGGCPFFAGAAEGGYVETPLQVPAAAKVRDDEGHSFPPTLPDPPVSPWGQGKASI